MTYAKPEILVIGEAARTIQGKPQTTQVDSGSFTDATAYDLDE